MTEQNTKSSYLIPILSSLGAILIGTIAMLIGVPFTLGFFEGFFNIVVWDITYGVFLGITATVTLIATYVVWKRTRRMNGKAPVE